jgi:hypothetical protein
MALYEEGHLQNHLEVNTGRGYCPGLITMSIKLQGFPGFESWTFTLQQHNYPIHTLLSLLLIYSAGSSLLLCECSDIIQTTAVNTPTPTTSSQSSSQDVHTLVCRLYLRSRPVVHSFRSLQEPKAVRPRHYQSEA